MGLSRSLSTITLNLRWLIFFLHLHQQPAIDNCKIIRKKSACGHSTCYLYRILPCKLIKKLNSCIFFLMKQNCFWFLFGVVIRLCNVFSVWSQTFISRSCCFVFATWEASYNFGSAERGCSSFFTTLVDTFTEGSLVSSLPKSDSQLCETCDHHKPRVFQNYLIYWPCTEWP